MNLLRYSATALLSLSGMYAGMVLARIAPEELEPGKIYFRMIQNILIALIVAVLAYTLFSKMTITILIFLITYGFLFFYFHSQRIRYLLFGPVFFLSLPSPPVFFIQSTLIFLHGFAAGTLSTQQHHKPRITTVITNIATIILPSLILAVLLYILQQVL